MCVLADEHLHKSCLDTCGRVGMDMSLCQQGGGRTQRPWPFAADVTVESENKGAREHTGGKVFIMTGQQK